MKDKEKIGQKAQSKFRRGNVKKKEKMKGRKENKRNREKWIGQIGKHLRLSEGEGADP